MEGERDQESEGERERLQRRRDGTEWKVGGSEKWMSQAISCDDNQRLVFYPPPPPHTHKTLTSVRLLYNALRRHTDDVRQRRRPSQQVTASK